MESKQEALPRDFLQHIDVRADAVISQQLGRYPSPDFPKDTQALPNWAVDVSINFSKY